MNPQSFWKKHEFAVNQTRIFKAGYAEVCVKHIENGWLVKSRVTDQASAVLLVEETNDLADDSDVLHFHTGKSHELLVVPALPNKAVVFRNNKNLKISAHESANLYFRIPLTMQFYFQEVKDDNRIVEIPLQRLSDTWFGEIESGEPAYSIGSNYDKSFLEIRATEWEAISSVEIINNTASVLDLQRLILRVEDFSLYLKNKRLLTSHATIEFKGQEQAGSVNLGLQKEIHGEKPVLVAKPRSHETRNLLRRSFFFIKNMYQN
ncbi:MAG TPA: DUF432 domain-containing protein [Prolixibacteraceae bacterium]|nr:DUF432 domain-containing protein [Prolixibacteraceae bacterium]